MERAAISTKSWSVTGTIQIRASRTRLDPSYAVNRGSLSPVPTSDDKSRCLNSESGRAVSKRDSARDGNEEIPIG